MLKMIAFILGLAMFFNYNKLLARLNLVLIFALACGCGFDQSKKEESDTFEAESKELSCLSDVSAQLVAFVELQSDETSVLQSWQCLQKTLQVFKRRGKSDLVDGYKAKELQNFLNRHKKLLKGRSLEDDFFAEIMKLKQLLVGGELTKLSFNELDKLNDIFGILEQVSVDLLPHLSVLFFNETSNLKEAASKNKLFAAQSALIKASEQLLPKLSFGSLNYKFSDFINFLRTGSLFIKGVEPTQTLPLLKLIEEAKVALFGTQDILENQDSWKKSVLFVIRIYNFALYTNSYFKGGVSLNSDGLEDFKNLNVELFNILDIAIEQRADKVLSYKNLDAFIDLFLSNSQRMAYLFGIDAESFKTTYKTLASRLLDQRSILEKQSVVGIEKTHIKTLRREFYLWIETQQFINNNFKETAKITDASWRKNLSIIQNIDWQNKYPDLGTEEYSEMERAWQEFKDIFLVSPSIFYNLNKNLNINAKDTKYRIHTQASLTQSNWIRGVLRLFMRGYSEDSVRSLYRTGLTKAEVQNIFTELRPMGIKIGLIDPRNFRSGERIFNEANLFSFSGNGDNLMQFREVWELVQLLLTGGVNVFQDFKEELELNHCDSAVLDVFNERTSNEDCFWKTYDEKKEKLFAHLPLWLKFDSNLKSMNQEAYAEMKQALMTIAQVGSHNDGLIESGELKTMIMILHYVETLHYQYDKDLSGDLSEEELVSAVPRFKNFILKAKDDLSEDDENTIENGFLFLVYDGYMPDLFDYAKFKFRRNVVGLGEATRLNILKVFAQLRNQISPEAAQIK